MGVAIEFPDDLPGASQALDQYLARYRRTYVRTKVEILMSLVGDIAPGSRILDYGAGGGFMSLLCARRGARVSIVEEDQGQLDAGRELMERFGLSGNCEFFRSSTVPVELRGAGFDLIIAKDVLEHVPDHLALLHDFAQTQSPNGRLLISTQNLRSLNYVLEGVLYNRWKLGRKDWCGWDDTHVRFYTPGSLRRTLAAAGYSVAKWGSNYIIPYDILSWLSLGRAKISLPWLSRVDLALGRIYPLNRVGWNLLALAQRTLPREERLGASSA